jgi:hypothetical protein
MGLTVIIPAYNEADSIADTIRCDRGYAIHDPAPPVPWAAQGLLSSESVETTFPLSSNACLLLRPEPASAGLSVAEIDARQVEKINLRTYGWAEEYVYGETQADLVSVRRAARQFPAEVIRPLPFSQAPGSPQQGPVEGDDRGYKLHRVAQPLGEGSTALSDEAHLPFADAVDHHLPVGLDLRLVGVPSEELAMALGKRGTIGEHLAGGVLKDSLCDSGDLGGSIGRAPRLHGDEEGNRRSLARRERIGVLQQTFQRGCRVILYQG